MNVKRKHTNNDDNKTKPLLPKGWIMKTSRKFPNRVYYFNVETGISTWDFPVKKTQTNDEQKKFRKTEEKTSEPSHSKQKPSKKQKHAIKKKMREKERSSNSHDINSLISKRELTNDSEKLSPIKAKRDEHKISDSISPKKICLEETSGKCRDEHLCNSSSKDLHEIPSNPFELALLATQKGSNNIPLLSLKGKLEEAAENKLRPALKARRNISAVPRKRTESSSVIVKQPVSSSKRAAQDRLENLQKKLSLDHKKNLSTPKSSLPLESRNVEKRSAATSVRDISRSPVSSSDATTGTTNITVEHLPITSFSFVKDETVLPHCADRKITDQKNSENSQDQNSYHVQDVYDENFDEAMDWEPIEVEQVLSHIQEVRNQILIEGLNYDGETKSKTTMFENCIVSSTETEEWFIVLDTNIFISNLIFIGELLQTNFKGIGMPILVIPWQVIQELDVMKDNKRNENNQPKLPFLARKAVQFIHKKLKENHPRLRGQTLSDAMKKESDHPDDSILHCCLQIAEKKKNVILLSNDINLCNKALINGIKAFQKSEIKDALEKMKLQDFDQENKCTHNETGPDISKSGTEQLLKSKNEDPARATEILSEFKLILKDLLGKILEYEMRKAFDDLWIKIIIFKPPWELHHILAAFLKHWLAVFSPILPRKCKSSIEILQKYFAKSNPTADGDSLAELKEIIAESLLLFKLLPKEFEVLRSESVSKLKNLMLQCEENGHELTDSQLAKPSFVNETSAQVLCLEAIRDVLEEFYNYILIFCGVMCDMLGFTHSLTYNKPDPFPSLNQVKEKLPDLYQRIDALVKSLSRVLETSPCSLNLEHESIKQLYFTFKNFLPNRDEVTPELVLSFCTTDDTRFALGTALEKFKETEVILERGISFFLQGSSF